jgi:hypothetical protein
MAKNSRRNLYTGRSGQLAVMALFLTRGYNVAIPEVDIGEDIFVVRDVDGNLSRVQVKSARAKGTRQHYGDYQVPVKQLTATHVPELFYIFAMYYDGHWRDYLVIARKELEALRLQGVGRLNRAGTHLKLLLSFSEADVTSNGISLQPFRNAWHHWPIIDH